MTNLDASGRLGLAITSSRCCSSVYTPLGCDSHCGFWMTLVRIATRAVPSSSFARRGPTRYLFLYSKVMRYWRASSRYAVSSSGVPSYFGTPSLVLWIVLSDIFCTSAQMSLSPLSLLSLLSLFHQPALSSATRLAKLKTRSPATMQNSASLPFFSWYPRGVLIRKCFTWKWFNWNLMKLQSYVTLP